MQDKKQVYYNYFEENILPVIKTIEDYRKKAVLKLVVSSFMFFVTGVIFAWLFIYNALTNTINPLLLPFLLFFMYVFILKSIVDAILKGKEYQKKLVDEVLPLFWKPVANFRKWPEVPDVEAVINSGLFPNFDTREDNLSFFGVYKGVNIIVSDTRLTLPVKAALKPNLFKGTVIQFEMPKSVNNHVILTTDYINCSYNRIKSNVKEADKQIFMFAKNLRNLDFINQDFWNLLKRFGHTYLAKTFKMSCKDNVVLIALQQKNPMQFGFLFKSLLNPKNYDDLIERFIVIFDLIDILS